MCHNEEKRENQIQKSRPLQVIQQCHLPMMAYKILDTYLSQIDMHDEIKDEYEISSAQLGKIWNTPDVHIRDLKNSLKLLMQPLEYTFDDCILLFHLFSRAKIEKNKSGKNIVKLKSSDEAKQYIFNVENIGYLRYNLAEVTQFTSKYSYLLYLYLKNSVKQYRGTSWEIGIEELKVILDVYDERDKVYKDNKYLIQVLKKAKVDIESKTKMRFDFSTVKSGGPTILSLQFKVSGTVANKLIKERNTEDAYKDFIEKEKEYQTRLETDEDFRKNEEKRGSNLINIGARIEHRAKQAACG